MYLVQESLGGYNELEFPNGDIVTKGIWKYLFITPGVCEKYQKDVCEYNNVILSRREKGFNDTFMDDIGIDIPENPISCVQSFVIRNIDKIIDISEPFKFVRGLPKKPDIISKESGSFFFKLNDIAFWVNSTLPEHTDLDGNDSFTTVIQGGRYRVQKNNYSGEVVNIFRFNGITT